jgi:GxxExxY protein
MALSHPESNSLTRRIIGAAIEVHSALGPGLLESVYEDCLYSDLLDDGLPIERQRLIPVVYHSRVIPAAFRADLIVAEQVIIEVKSLEKILPVHKSQLLTYMKLAHISVGLLINFNVSRLVDGLTRLSL